MIAQLQLRDAPPALAITGDGEYLVPLTLDEISWLIRTSTATIEEFARHPTTSMNAVAVRKLEQARASLAIVQRQALEYLAEGA